MTSHRHWIGLVGLLAAVVVGVLTLGSLTTQAGAQLTPIEDEPGLEAPGLGNIVGSPEAGPEPEDAGDRGGWAQLGLAVLLVVAVAFIGSRILKESRSSRGRPGASPPGAPDASGEAAL